MTTDDMCMQLLGIIAEVVTVAAVEHFAEKIK
jgi:hypothetical protein